MTFDLLQPLYADGSSYSSDSYTRYTSNPANKHDDSKLREKFGTTQLPRPPDKPSRMDPYQFTRSTAEPYKPTHSPKTAPNPNPNPSRKLSDVTAKYRYMRLYVSRLLASSTPAFLVCLLIM